MKKWRIRVWFQDVVCNGDAVRVYFALPDTFFEIKLYACRSCSSIIGVDQNREHYEGKKFDDLRTTLNCPSCTEPLSTAMEYPQSFRCPDGSLGHFELPNEYPPDSDLVDLDVWDPYACAGADARPGHCSDLYPAGRSKVDESMTVWEEIHGFGSPGEYQRFVKYIEGQVASGVAEQVEGDPNYGRGKLSGGRWFKNKESGEIWRLVPPDPPFRGLWEPVVR